MGLSTDVTAESGDKDFGLFVKSPFNLAEFANYLVIEGTTTVNTKETKPVAQVELTGPISIEPLEDALKDQKQATISLNKYETAVSFP